MSTEEIGSVIREYRQKNGLTQKELGEAIGISDKAISRWETGRTMPDLEMYSKVCSLLNIPQEKTIINSLSTSDASNNPSVTNTYMSFSRHKNHIKFFAIAAIFASMIILTFFLSTTLGNSAMNSFPATAVYDNSKLSVDFAMENGNRARVELYSPGKDELNSRIQEYGAGEQAVKTND